MLTESQLPSVSTAAMTDKVRLVVGGNSRNMTLTILKALLNAGAVPSVAYSTSVDLSKVSQTNAITALTAAATFAPNTSTAVSGGVLNMVLEADGVSGHEPTFTTFKRIGVGTYLNVAGIRNHLRFSRIGTEYFVEISPGVVVSSPAPAPAPSTGIQALLTDTFEGMTENPASTNWFSVNGQPGAKIASGVMSDSLNSPGSVQSFRKGQFAANQFSELTIASINSGDAGPWINGTINGNSGYRLVTKPYAWGIQFFRINGDFGGTYTAWNRERPAVGDRIAIRRFGNDVIVSHNDEDVQRITSNETSGETQPGVFFYEVDTTFGSWRGGTTAKAYMPGVVADIVTGSTGTPAPSPAPTPAPTPAPAPSVTYGLTTMRAAQNGAPATNVSFIQDLSEALGANGATPSTSAKARFKLYKNGVEQAASTFTISYGAQPTKLLRCTTSLAAAVGDTFYLSYTDAGDGSVVGVDTGTAFQTSQTAVYTWKGPAPVFTSLTWDQGTSTRRATLATSLALVGTPGASVSSAAKSSFVLSYNNSVIPASNYDIKIAASGLGVVFEFTNFTINTSVIFQSVYTNNGQLVALADGQALLSATSQGFTA